MSETKVTQRDLVKAEIEKGTKTKKDIAEILDISEGSVSSQMTYLRWFGNYIKTDADKVLTFVSEEEFNAWQEEVKANRKTRSVSTKTPEEQATTLAKTIKSQTKTLAAWDKKLENTELALEDEPDDADLNEYLDECGANITLLKIKLRRNKAKADTLPEAEEVDEPEVDVDEDEELI